jgi:isoleucyl-tRNA synthetase
MKQIIEEEVNVKKAILKTADSFSVSLDTHISPELKQEGYMREMLRHIQNHRKKAGLNVEDRIELSISGDKALLSVFEMYKEDILKEILATSLNETDKEYEADIIVEKLTMHIGISKCK